MFIIFSLELIKVHRTYEVKYSLLSVLIYLCSMMQNS